MTTKAARPIRQIIGGRTVPDPRGEIQETPEGRAVWVSLETCRCGWSLANPGVGYWDGKLRAWICKQCGQAHTKSVTERSYRRNQARRIARLTTAAGG